MRSLATIIENLAQAQSKLLRAADAVPSDQWKTRPAEGRWSAGELVGHLIMIERAIISRADRMLSKAPKEVPFFKRFHMPMAVVESRLIRRKTPIPLETIERDLSKYRMPHPFLGSSNAYEWLQMIASHEIRHTKQMREIAGSLPKTVTSLEK